MQYKDRVLETTTSTGTGDLTLAGAMTGYLSFSGAGIRDSQQVAVVIETDGTPTEWEVCITHVLSGVIKRAGVQKVIASSNSGNAVSFSSGTKRVFVTAAAAQHLDHGLALALTSGLFVP